MQTVHGIRIGGEGPLCVCGEWGCDRAMDSKADRRTRVLTWVGVVLVWLAMLALVGLVVLGLVIVSAMDAQQHSGGPMVTPSPYPGPPA